MKCFCFDLDGTLYRGDEPAEYAAELVSLLQKRNIPYAAVTNCPMRAPEETAARLEKMGIPMPAERVISSGMTAAKASGRSHSASSASAEARMASMRRDSRWTSANVRGEAVRTQSMDMARLLCPYPARKRGGGMRIKRICSA